MRQVVLTERKPECVFSATAHNTAWISTKIMLALPRPNQIIDKGSKAIDGNGLNIEVNVSSRSAPTRVALANAVSSAAMSSPAIYPCNRSEIDVHVALSNVPVTMPEKNACMVVMNVGNNRGLSDQRA